MLESGTLEVEGQLVAASNLALRVWMTAGSDRIAAVYKPIRGERPLHDFPADTLAGREWAAFRVSDAGGWDVIPPTVLRNGPFGRGSVQQWVGPLDPDPDEVGDVLHVGPIEDMPAGHCPIAELEDELGRDVVVSHSSADVVRSVAALDVLLNNADRKASALINDGPRLWAIDHGLCFHNQNKLRTVLWGFAGDELSDADLVRLDTLLNALESGLIEELEQVLDDSEIYALVTRVERLRRSGRMPQVPVGRYPLPWPLW